MEIILRVSSFETKSNAWPVCFTGANPNDQASGWIYPAWQDQQVQTLLRNYRTYSIPNADQKTLGDLLFQAVFQGEQLALFRRFQSQSEHTDESITLRVITPNDETRLLPWELLYDQMAGDGRGAFLCQWPWFELIHSLPDDEVKPHGILASSDSICRMLVVSANPQDLPRLDIDAELQIIHRLFDPYVKAGRLELQVLHAADRRMLHDSLCNPWDILHFIGHAGWNEDDQHCLILEQEAMRDDLTPEEFNAMLYHGAPRLVFLNACQSGEMVRGAWSVALILLAAGTSAVVTSHTRLIDSQALSFTEGFYHALIAGLPVEKAGGHARANILSMHGPNSQWYAPRLFVRHGIAPARLALTSEKVAKDVMSFSASFQISLRRISSASDSPLKLSGMRLLADIFAALGIQHMQGELRITKYLGANAELVSPHCQAVRSLDGFLWRLGDEIVGAVAGLSNQLSIRAFVRIAQGSQTIWESEKLTTSLEAFSDRSQAGNVVLTIPYRGPLLAPGEYTWNLTLRYPTAGPAGQVDFHQVVLPSAFRLLNQQEWEEYQNLIACLPPSQSPFVSALLRGAISEVFGLYEEAVRDYQQAQQDPELTVQAGENLKRVWSKQAEGILRPSGPKNVQPAIMSFVEKL